MKKVIKFSRVFLPMVVMSSALIALGLVGYFVKGLNLGIDFQAGLIEKVRLAPTAFELTYAGEKSVTVSLSSSQIDLVSTGVASDNQTFSFPFAQYATVGDLASALASVPGVSVATLAPASAPAKGIFANADGQARLSAEAYRLHYLPADAPAIGADQVRAAISSFPEASVQAIGAPADRLFQIRLSDDGADPEASKTLRTNLNAALAAAFGADNVAVVSADFVGSRFSKSLASQAFWLVAATLVLIWVYCAIRFRWDFAVGGVLAIVHDALIMVAFIVWSRMQFNSTTIAAILTILGYSINDTVVIFDRIRENMRLRPELNITEILDLSQTEILGRTVITTVTTMLAVLSLYVFTTGDMKDFALALLVGMTSGVYSTIYIASAFISFASRFRKDKGISKEKAKPVRLAEEQV
jgi:preprotein translocase subunit SecF